MNYSLLLSALFLLLFSNTTMAQTDEKTVQMEEKQDVEVPLSIVEVPPIYPGCTSLREESIKCLFEKIHEKFNKAFVFPSSIEKKEQRLFVSFVVSKEGFLKVSSVRSQHKEIDEKVWKIFNDLPQLFPGTQRNKPVPVTFSLPFTLNKGL
jgi:protein TonB